MHRHLVIVYNSNLSRAASDATQHVEWADAMFLLRQPSGSSDPGREAACVLFVKLMHAVHRIEAGLPVPDTDKDGCDPWDDISSSLMGLEELLKGSDNPLPSGWAPGFSLGRRHELWMLVEISSMASLHGRTAFWTPFRV